MKKQTVLFDLDGTLVQTERLKARSYARAARELKPDIDEDDVVDAYREVVGGSRKTVAEALVKRFSLDAASAARMGEYDARKPWQAFVGVRLELYHRMTDDRELIRDHIQPGAYDLVVALRERCRHVGLATTSSAAQTANVLRALDMSELFDFVVTADDVEHTKPDPEPYLLLLEEFGDAAEVCIAVEDSLNGISAALAAGIDTIAVPTEFTEASVKAREWPPSVRMVESRDELSSHLLSNVSR